MSVSELINSIDATIANLGPGGPASDADRQQLLAASKRLQAASESPLDTVLSIVLGIHRESAVRTAVEMGLFNTLIAVPEEGITAQELSQKTNSDEIFITRIMRFLTAMGFSKELGVRHYAPTPKTGFFVTGSPLTDVITHIAVHSQILTKLPEYFKERGDFKNPSDVKSGPFQFASGYKGTYFEWLEETPEQQSAFNRMMALTRLERGEQWFEFFPAEERFGSGDPNVPLLVDIGGGLGHDLAAFHTKFPNLPGKLILQDLPPVISEIKDLDSSIDRTVHNFFEPQPVKGAKAYYLRTVLHDWADTQAIEILKNIREAMTSDSVLLLNENFLPEKDVPLYNAEVDFSMLALFSSLERTEKQWTSLLEAAGLKVVKVWTPKTQLTASAKLFEAVRVD